MGQVGGGCAFSVCLDNEGDLWTFGENVCRLDSLGLNVYTPQKIPTFAFVVSVSCGYYHTVCLDDVGRVWSFGSNHYRQLGFGNKTNYSTPQVVPFPEIGNEHITSIECGEYHTLCIDSRRFVWAFGKNYSGQLGMTQQIVRSPQRIPGLSSIIQISTNGNFSLFLNDKGICFGCGRNFHGQLGKQIRKLETYSATRISDDKFIAIAAGNIYSLLLNERGEVFMLGSPVGGELTKITMPLPVKRISAACDISFLLDSDDTLWMCGDMSFGKNNTTENISIPKVVPNLGPVDKIPQGFHHAIVKEKDGNIYVFGRNERGQLGLGHCQDIEDPVLLEGFSHIIRPSSFRIKSACK